MLSIHINGISIDAKTEINNDIKLCKVFYNKTMYGLGWFSSYLQLTQADNKLCGFIECIYILVVDTYLNVTV